jgi:NAD(P)-dependent dehydrogenase (short-subunit alcohol dehydrogenase family)
MAAQPPSTGRMTPLTLLASPLASQVIDAASSSASAKVVNVSSEASLRASASGVAYTASKHAVDGPTKSVAVLHGPKGIRANAIAPGAVQTNIEAPFKSVCAQERLGPLITFISIEPRPASIIPGSTARVRRMLEVRFTAKTRSQVASSISASGIYASMIPATLASTSTRPPAVARSVWAVSSSDTSPATMTMLRSGKSVLSSSRRFWNRSLAMTAASSLANRMALARPILNRRP